MTNRKNTRNALFTSFIALLLCFSMLIGTTFAWFTDSVTSANNIIKSGNLDVELYYQVENQSDWTKVTAETSVFMKDALWEPGHTEVVKLKVVNEGSLALKYQLGVNVASETGSVNALGNEFKLSNYIKFGIVEGAQTYTRDAAVAAVDASAKALSVVYGSDVVSLQPGADKVITMVVYMPTSVGNEANHAKDAAQPVINLGINLFATQLESELDSFGNDYDKDAIIANSAETAQEALDNAGPGAVIKLSPGVNYGILYLRPVAGTAPTKEVDWIGNNYRYETYSLFENLTIVGAEGATVDAIVIEGGTYYNTKHSQSETYPVMLSLVELKNVVIDGVTFTGKGGYDPEGHGNVINLSGANIKVDGLTLKNCVLNDPDNKARLIYKTESTTHTHNYSYADQNYTFQPTLEDITVTGCTFNGGYMGLELRETENVTITNNIFNVADRNILLPVNTGCTYSGKITITGNVSNNAKERLVRADGTGDAVVVIKDNTLNNYQGADQDYIKVTNGNNVTIENNTLNDNWDGTVPAAKPASLVVDTTNHVISVNSVEAFIYLNTLLNDGTFADTYGSKWQYAIELNADIDLQDKEWTPVNLSNIVSFDGNGHTISNLNVNIDGDNAGLFGAVTCNDIGATVIRNFTIKNATVSGNQCVGTVIGNAMQGSVENVTVINATVTGTKYVGGIYGWGSGMVNNCTVKDSSITIPADGSKEAGGLTGYTAYDGKVNAEYKYIRNNTVENVTVKAPTIASGLVSQPNSSSGVIVIENNTLKDVTVFASDNTAALEVSNNVSNKTIVRNNTSENSKVGCEVYGLKLTLNADTQNYGTITVSDKEGLLNLTKLNADWTKLFTDGNGNDFGSYPISNYYYNWTWNIVLTNDIDFGGAQIQPIDLGKKLVFDGQGHTIKNAVIVTDSATANEAGLFDASECGVKDLKLDNIHVTGSNIGDSTAGVLSGSCNAGIDNVTVTNSSVTGGKYTGGVVGYGYTNVTNCTVTNTVVKGGYKLGGLIGYICASDANGKNVKGNTLTKCTVDGIGGGVYAGGKTQYIVGKVVGNYNCNGECTDNTITEMITSATENIGKIEGGQTVTQ